MSSVKQIKLRALLTFGGMVFLFSLFTQTDRTDYLKRATELAQEVIILDGHIDLPYRIYNQKYASASEYLPEILHASSGEFDYTRAQAGGLDVAFMSIYVPATFQETGGAKAEADTMIGMVKTIIASYPDKFATAGNPTDIRKNLKAGLISLPMGMENGAPIETMNDLDTYYEKGIRYVTLTHSRDNHICDSSYDTTGTWGGLSPFGKKLILAMNKTGMLIDVSHLSDEAFYQVIELSKVPVVATHSSCRAFTPGWERNMSDDMIKALAEQGGVIQINFGSDFLDNKYTARVREHNIEIDKLLEEAAVERKSGEGKRIISGYWKAHPKRYATVEQVADHIDHVVRLAGIDHVGLGSDFDGVGDSLPTGLKHPGELPNLIAVLLQRGYSEEGIARIAGLNVLRVWDEAEAFASEYRKGN